MDAPRLALVTVLAAVVFAGGAIEPNALISMLASAAALVAARERRHRSMALAAGMAAGASSAGLALLPVLIGTTVARRASPRVGDFVAALLATSLLIGWTPATDKSLVTLLPHDLTALLLATAAGIAAWIGASCASRPPLPREIDRAALLACLSLPLLAPIGAEAAGLAVALALGGTGLSIPPIARAANDDPLPRRSVAA